MEECFCGRQWQLPNSEDSYAKAGESQDESCPERTTDDVREGLSNKYGNVSESLNLRGNSATVEESEESFIDSVFVEQGHHHDGA